MALIVGMCLGLPRHCMNTLVGRKRRNSGFDFDSGGRGCKGTVTLT